MRCTHCGAQDITVVAFSSGDGATYRYCRHCETGVWESDGRTMGKQQVLRVASRIEPARRRAAA